MGMSDFRIGYSITLIYLPSDFRVASAANISEHLTIGSETPGTASPTLFD